ncbi:MAG: AbrB family transcriptional regulator [Paracoccaceae bacterium]
MSEQNSPSIIVVTIYTLLTGFAGAMVAKWLSFPVYILTGPAILISLISLFGVRFALADVVRDGAFLVIGIGLGAGINQQALDSVMRWPLAFATLASLLLAILYAGRFLLVRYFGFDQRSAVLASSPGHLSYILGLGVSLKADIVSVSVVQSIRLLALTLLVPFVVVALGVDLTGAILPKGTPMSYGHLALLLALSLGVGLVLKRYEVPAALLIGGLSVSAIAHGSEMVPGVMAPEIALPFFTIMGTLIGTRFSGVTLAQLRAALGAGMALTVVSVALSAIAAVPVAMLLGWPSAHVLVAFAPGGLETMVAMGGVLGANPGFVVACHVGRLFMLTVLVPLVLAGDRRAERKAIERP